ncbi:MAG: GAF domain-containing protein [Anaerolineae bacterium]
MGLQPNEAADAPLCMAAVPMLTDSIVVGVLLAYDWRNPRAFNPVQLETLRQIGEQSASMLRNASLYTRVFEMADSLALLNNVSAVVSATLDLETVLETISNIIIEVGHADKTGIFLANDARTEVVLEYSVGLSYPFVKMFSDFARDQQSGPKQMLQHWTSLAITDVQNDPRAQGWQELAEVEDYSSMLLVPLIASDKIIGFLAAFYSRTHQFEQPELDLMNTLANQVAVTVSNARLHQDTQNRTRELANLVDVSRTFTSTLDLDGVLQNVLEALTKAVSPTVTVIAEAHSIMVGMPLNVLAQQGLKADQQIIASETLNHALTFRQPVMLEESPQDYEVLHQLNVEALYAIPMVNQDEAFGMALIGYSSRQYLDNRRRQLAEAILNQASTAIRNAQLFSQVDEALDARVNELVAIETLSRKISASLDGDEIIEETLKIAQRVTGADLAAFATPLNSDPSFLKFVQQFSSDVNMLPLTAIIPRGRGIVHEVLNSGQSMQFGDVRDYPGYLPSGVPEVRSEMVVPVKYKGETLGVLNLESRRLDAFTGSHRSFVVLLAEHVGVAINNARLFIERQTQLENLIQLRNMSLRLLDAKASKEALQQIVTFALTIMKARDVHLYLYNPISEQLTFGASIWSDGRENVEARQPSSDGRTWRVAHTGQMLLIPDVSKVQASTDSVDERGYGSIARVPIKRGEQVFGVLVLTFREPQFFDDGKVRTLDLIATQSAIAIQNVTLFEEVQNTRDQMQVILNSARDGMALVSSSGTLLLVNKAAERMFGKMMQSAVGHKVFRLLVQVRRMERLSQAHQPPPLLQPPFGSNLQALLPEEEQKNSVAQGIDALLDQIKAAPDQPTKRTYTLNIPGSIRDIEETTLPVQEEGHLVGRLIVMRDISEEKAEERFREEVQDILIHDLRAPTSNMLTTLQLMVELINMEEYKELGNVTGIAIEGAERLLNLIGQLLDLAKAAELQPAEYSLYAVVQKAMTTLQSSARDANLTVLNHIPEEFPLVYIDEGKITRVFVNLLDNGLRHTPVGGSVRFEASVISQPDGDYARISVIDTGKGIPEEHWTKIFQKFVQVKGSNLRGHKGSGLGLTFCQKIVEAHGGKIWVDRGPEGGAAFWLTLPLVRRDALPLPTVTPTPSHAAGE